MPPGELPQAKPAAISAWAALPGVDWPLLPHERETACPLPAILADWSVGLRTLENSPSLAKRKDEPQLPRTVAPVISSRIHVNATLGLLVEPVSSGLPL